MQTGTSLVVKWLRIHIPNVGVLGLISGQGTRSHRLQVRLKILHACMLQASPGAVK